MRLPEDWLELVERPSRYLGRELNLAPPPERAALSVALCVPDLYEVGMSWFGMQVLYGVLSLQGWVRVERAFLPGVDAEGLLRSRGAPLGTVETGRPLREFDLVGISLQHELAWSAALRMLELARIPLRWERRSEADPLVIAGGPACLNPAPLEPFFDALVMGEGEEVLVEICQLLRELRAAPRRARLEALAGLQGVYVPALPRPVRKRVVADLENSFHPVAPLVPWCRPVHDRLTLEIARGCPRGCRFCLAGMTTRPLRERSSRRVLQLLQASLPRTGHEQVGLLSLSAGDHSQIEAMLRALMDWLAPQGVSLSLPSLRADSLRPALLQQIARVRRTAFTIAPEAGSQRLRDVVGKGLAQEEILEAVGRAFGAGWSSLKMYFMVGLPTETDDDLAEIAELVRRTLQVARRAAGRAFRRLTVNLATFVPKPHTPFQWEPQVPPTEARRRLRLVQRLLPREVEVRWHDPHMSWVEGALGRAGREAADLLEEACRRGAGLESYREHFHRRLWEELLGPPEEALGARDPGASLPWEVVDTGVRREFLWAERLRALEGRPSPPCRPSCDRCGACGPIGVRLAALGEPAAPPCPGPPPAARSALRVRVRYQKRGWARWLGHLELVNGLLRAMRRARLPLRRSEGFHPLPRVDFGPALPLGVESGAEYMDLELTAWVDPPQLLARLREQLPPELRPLEARILSLRSPSLSASICAAEYRLIPQQPCALDEVAGRLRGQEGVVEVSRQADGLLLRLEGGRGVWRVLEPALGRRAGGWRLEKVRVIFRE